MLLLVVEVVEAKKSFESQKAYVGWIRRWFVNNGVFIDDTLFKQQVRFKKPERERKFAFDLETLRSMIKVSNRDHRIFLLFLISTGARQGEVLQLTAGDIDWTSTPVMVNFRAGITKTKQEQMAWKRTHTRIPTFELKQLTKVLFVVGNAHVLMEGSPLELD